MPKASELKRGSVVEINGQPYVVNQIDVKAPSSRGANTLYKVRFNHVQTGQKLDETFKGEDLLGDIDLERRRVQFSYMDGEQYVFMNTDDYSQYMLDAASMDGQLDYLTDGLDGITALLVEDSLVAIDLPQSVVVEIVETAPVSKAPRPTPVLSLRLCPRA